MSKKTIALAMILAMSVLGCGKGDDLLVVISTEFGDMTILLYDQTPEHKKNFLKLSSEKFFDKTTFHRVMSGFMVQGGDPYSRTGEGRPGTGGPGYTLAAEIVPGLTHKKGALAAARQPDRVNPEKRSSGSQFYIVHEAKNCEHLTGKYTIFGEVLEGLKVVDQIAAQAVGPGSLPVSDIKMTVVVKKMSRKKVTQTYGYIYPEPSK